MNKIFMLVLLAISSVASAENVIMSGTRFIYPANEKEITVQMTNNSSHPALVQAWLDDGNENTSPDDIDVPFVITPPVARIESKSAQALRIRNINKSKLPTDRESVLYLNVLEIPPTAKGTENQNSLALAIRSRFKFFYRPAKLGNVNKAPSELQFTPSGNAIAVSNPTPFNITIIKVTKSGGKNLIKEPVMIAPKSSLKVPSNSAVNHGENVAISIINDYGTTIDYNFNIK